MQRIGIRHLGFERFEQRRLLAGNVNASVSEFGALTITGDGAGNTISVESHPNGVQVRGFGTTVNGSGTTKVFNVPGDVIIRTGAGDDLVRVTNLVIEGQLRIELGAGNDEAVAGRDKSGGDARFADTTTGPLWVHQSFVMLGANGNDLSYQSQVHVKGAGLMNLGAGVDRLQVARFPGSPQEVKYFGALDIYPGADNDAINVSGLVVEDNVSVLADVGRLGLVLRSTEIRGNLSVLKANADAVADAVSVVSTNVSGVFTLSMSGGNDVLNIAGRSGQLIVRLGAGNDVLNLRAVRADDIDTLGGVGDDLFFVRNTRAFDAFFNGNEDSGGADVDTYRDTESEPNLFALLTRINIEQIETI